MAKILTKDYSKQEFTICVNGDEKAYIILSLMDKLTSIRSAEKTGISLSKRTLSKIEAIEALIKELQ